MTCDYVGCNGAAMTVKVTTWTRPDGTRAEQTVPLCKRHAPADLQRVIAASFRGIPFRTIYQTVKG